MTDKLRLGDIVRANETFPHFHEWRDAKLKVVSLRADPEGNEWVSVIEGSPRHRGNGLYDSETTDIKADWLTPISPAPGPPADGALEAAARYLDDLESGMLPGNADKPSQVAEKLRGIPRHPPAVAAESAAFAWTIPGDNQADCNGFIPTKIAREGEFTKPLYASPPVRGDRETIKRAVCCPEGCQYEGDSEDGSKCYCDTSDYNGSGVEKRANAVFAVLSLPVQSGAGEREAFQNEPVFQGAICERVDAWRALPEYADVTLVDWLAESGIIAKPAPNPDMEFAFAWDLNEAICDAINGGKLGSREIAARVTTDPKIKEWLKLLPPSRQAPHSSSETES